MGADVVTSIQIKLLDAFTAPMRGIGAEVEGLGRKFSAIGGASDRFFAGMRKSVALTSDLKNTGEAFERFGQRMKNAIEDPFERFAKFETGMKGLQNVGKLDDTAVGQLARYVKDKSIQIGANTGDIQESLNELLAANFSLGDAKTVQGEAFKLARGNRLSNADATGLQVGTMQSFGLGADQAAHVANVLAAADDVSTASAVSLGDFLSRTGSTARASHTSLETTAAIGATLKDAGRKDLTESATSFNNVINRLSAPSVLGGKALASVGISGKGLTTLRNDVTGGKLLTAIQKIDAAFTRRGLTDAQRTDKIKAIFGEGGQEMSIFRDLAASLKLGDKGVLGKITTFQTGVEGTTDRKSKNLDNSAAARMEKMKARWDVLMVDMGEKLEPVVSGLMNSIGPVVADLGDWVGKNPELAKGIADFAVKFGGLALVAGPLTNLVTVISGGFGVLTSVGAALSPVVSAITTAMGLTIGPILAAAAAGAWLGYELGTMYVKATHLDEFLAEKFFGWFHPDEDAEDAPGTKTFGDGSKIDAQGRVVKLGSGPNVVAPKVVREARAGGASTKEEINRAIAFRGPPTGAPTEARPPQAPASAPAGDSEAAAATKEQTATLVAALRDQTEATKSLLDETKRRGRARPSAGAGAGVGQGQF